MQALSNSVSVGVGTGDTELNCSDMVPAFQGLVTSGRRQQKITAGKKDDASTLYTQND